MKIEGKKLKAAREKAGITQEELSQRLECNLRDVVNMERNQFTLVTKDGLRVIIKALDCDADDVIDMTSSHSEKQILEGCIALMHELTGYFQEYLEFMDIKPSNEEEQFAVNMQYSHIVNRLFLWSTSHSGGTSTAIKCRDLGVDYGDSIRFYTDQKN